MKKDCILIVGDDVGVRKNLSDILREKGYEVVTITAGMETGTGIRGVMSDVSAALIDFNGDDMSVLKVIKEIRETSPGTECIVLAGFDASQERVVEAVNMGAYNYLKKPCDVDQLLLTIRRACEKHDVGEALQESEVLYSSVFENTASPTCILEGNRTISMINSAFEVLSGHSKETVEGKMSWTDFVLDEDITMMKAYHNKRMENDEGLPSEHAFRFIDRQGNIKDIALKLAVIDGTNKTLCSLMDMSERHRIEQALLESEKQYRSLMETAADMIFTLDREGKFTYINPAYERVTGYAVEKFIGRAFTDALVTEHIKSTIGRFERGISGKTNEFFEVEFKHKDGRKISVELNMTSLFNAQGMPKGRVGIARNISERRQLLAEKKNLEVRLQQAQKMEAIGTLAGGIAHDFNNLLMGIEGNASLLFLNMDPMHPHYERLKNIEQYVRDGADLTGHLLGFARGGKYEVKPTDLNRLIEKSSDMFGRTKKEIKIHRRFQTDIWVVEVDQGQIERTLLNIFVNAWQAMPGGGELYLQTENITLDKNYIKPYYFEHGRYVKMSITDTGVGMDKETVKRIFEPFFTTKERSSTKGTGLGLASAYGIIKNHGGMINVYSEKGVGATFNIYLPVSVKEVAVEEKLTEKFLTGTETIFLVDNEEMIIDVGKEILEALGYTLLLARSGEEAIAEYVTHKDKIDMVILDMIMPGMCGGEVYDILREINPDIKVLLSSGYSINGQATEILKRGCDNFIQKPFNIEQISHKVRKILDQ